MIFCPTCGNILLIEKGAASFRYFCKTCSYVFNVNQKIKRVQTFEDKKVIDLIYDEEKEWSLRPITEKSCKQCNNNKCYYVEQQTRSADEPTTYYYRCTNKDCGYTWSEN